MTRSLLATVVVTAAVAIMTSQGTSLVASSHGCSDQIIWIDFGRGLWAADATGSTTNATLPASGLDGSDLPGDWSSDGELLAWSDRNDIWIANADGADPHVITNSGDHIPTGNEGPVISPDGRFVAWTGIDPQTEEREVYLAEIDGSARRVLSRKFGTVPVVGDPNRTAPTHNSFIDWRSDGERLVWHGQDPDGYSHIYSSSRLKGTMTKLTDTSDGIKHARFPEYSPDDDHRLAYERIPLGSNNADIVVDGQIVSTGQTSAYGPVAWSPDGTRIAWTANNAVSALGAEIYHARIDGSDRVHVDPTEPLTQNGYPAWSPDGTQLAWAARGGPHPSSNMRIWVAALDGSDVYLLSEEPEKARYPAWRPKQTNCSGTTLSIGGAATVEQLNPARRCAFNGCP